MTRDEEDATVVGRHTLANGFFNTLDMSDPARASSARAESACGDLARDDDVERSLARVEVGATTTMRCDARFVDASPRECMRVFIEKRRRRRDDDAETY